VRIVLVVLFAFSLLGALDHSWDSPYLLVLPVLCLVCWAMASRMEAQGKKIAVLEKLLREQARSRTGPAGAASRDEQAWPDEGRGAAALSPQPSPGRGEAAGAGEEFTFSVQEEPAAERVAPAPRQQGLAGIVWTRLRDWLAGGNPVVRVGLVVLFFGVSFLLKYASDRGLLSVEARMAGAGLLGVALLAVGWVLRRSRPAYAVLVQGGGVGVLYLTIFAAARFLDMIPPFWALALMSAVVVLSGALAVLQNASPLALFGAAGGFAAPILLSTGQGDHVQLFSYYALLNLGVLGIAWRKAWRSLNLLGFCCTFGIGALWGAGFYRPEFFDTVEPFLILFFVMYGLVSILFARANQEGGLVRLDSALVFGLPLAAFALQTGLVRDMEFGGAYSCLGLALWYLLPLKALRGKGEGLRLLAEAHLALGVIFVSLAVPMALDATWTASTWALEGAGMIWLGHRQGRLVTRVFGLLLQLGAGLAFAASLAGHAPSLDYGRLLAGLFLGLGGLFSGWSCWSFRGEKKPWEERLPLALGLWGAVWWYGAWFWWSRDRELADVIFLAVLTGSQGAWLLLQRRTRWPWACRLAQASVALLLAMAVIWQGHPGGGWGWLGWPLALAVHFMTLFTLEDGWEERVRGWVHGASSVLVMILALREAHWQVFSLIQAGIWADAAFAAIGAVLLLAVSFPILAWPLGRHFAAYLRSGALLAAVLGLWWAAVCLVGGDPRPLPYVPVLNPLDLAQALVLASAAVWGRRVALSGLPESPAFGRFLPPVLAGWGFVWLNVVVVRAVHFLGEVPYAATAMFRSEVLQSALAVFWSLAALAAMIAGRRWRRRQAWLAGAGLLGVVVVKLFLVDLDGRGTVARIVSFLGVGILMLVVGYFCPLPPKEEKS
jgi:uncharacterized membrane protein